MNLLKKNVEIIRVSTQKISYACLSSSNEVFDRQLKKRQRHWAITQPDCEYYEYLRKEVASRLVDRLQDITKSFPVALELGCHNSHFLKELLNNYDIDDDKVIGGLTTLVQSDFSPHISSVSLPALLGDELNRKLEKSKLTVHSIELDEEVLPFNENTFDLVISPMSMHWVNDLPSSFKQIKRILKPDGAFVCSMLGGSTLEELQHCLYLADQERRGGISPHTSPYARASDIAAIMQSTPFSLPTVDVDTIKIGYPNAFVLMEHIQKMGESNACLQRELMIGKDTFLAAASIYQHMYGLPDGSVTATYQVISMIGWKEDATQPKPCKRGSATSSLKEIGHTHS